MDHVVEEVDVDPVKTLSEFQLLHMRPIGGTWAVYQNQVMDSSGFGDKVCLRVGEDCTHKTPPPHAPDGHYGLGWKYLYIGMADLERGVVNKVPRVP